MKLRIIVITIIVFIAFVTVYTLKNYNNLVILRNELDKNWENVVKEMKARFDFVLQYITAFQTMINPNYSNQIQNINARFLECTKPLDFINIYIELEKSFQFIQVELMTKGCRNIEWENALKESKTRFDNVRQIYNDNCLKMSNKVNMFPSNIISSIFKFSKRDYFRNEN